MKCPKCNNDIDPAVTNCPYCGSLINQLIDNGNIGWGILGGFFPIVGLILFLTWKDEKPKCSKQAGIGALIGTIIQVVGSMMSVLLLIFFFSLLNPFINAISFY